MSASPSSGNDSRSARQRALDEEATQAEHDRTASWLVIGAGPDRSAAVVDAQWQHMIEMSLRADKAARKADRKRTR